MNAPRLPQLLAFDLDGTLLPESKELTPYTLDVLRRMRELGCQITVSTGKFHHLAARYGRDLDLDLPQISLDGATVGGNGHPLVNRGIAHDLALQLLEAYQPRSVHAFADNGRDVMLLRSPATEFRTATQFWADDVRHVDDLSDHVEDDSAVVSFYGDEQPMRAMVDEVLEHHPELRIAEFFSQYLGMRRITFQPAGVDKGTGVLQVAAGAGIAAEDCMVFGDWLNDLPMFGIGAMGVAMQNATPEVHEVAEWRTEHSCENDGVARFLEQHFL